jgi:hypothetical protein
LRVTSSTSFHEVATFTGRAGTATVAVLLEGPVVVGAPPVTCVPVLPVLAHHGMFVFTVTTVFPPVAVIPVFGDADMPLNTGCTRRRSFAVVLCAAAVEWLVEVNVTVVSS